jgi:hypothetical protein
VQESGIIEEFVSGMAYILYDQFDAHLAQRVGAS